MARGDLDNPDLYRFLVNPGVDLAPSAHRRLSLHSAELLRVGQVLVRFQHILRAHPGSKVAFLSAIVVPGAVIQPATLRPIATCVSSR